MSIDIFAQSSSSDEQLRAFVDQSKVKEITEKLCIKRKEIEDKLKSCTKDEKDGLLLELLEKQTDLRAFGVSEIDYQAHLARSKITTN